MSHRHLLARLLPPRAYDANSEHIAAELRSEGASLDRVQTNAANVINSMTPFYAVDTLPDWERVCGLKPPSGATRQQRLDAVLAKLREVGGLSIPYFMDVAASLGYDITIIEYQAFYCDYSLLDVDRLYEDDVQWVWQVNVTGGQVRMFPFFLDSSSVDELLLDFSDAIIEAVIDDLKPAWTAVVFNYVGETH